MNFKKSFGLVQIPLLIGLLLMAVAIPVATRLVQDNQANQGKAATADIPCKVCVGSLCKTVATNCMATMNECNTNANCVISCSTVCPAVCSTTYLGSYCGVDGCGKACYGTKPFPPTVVPTKIPKPTVNPSTCSPIVDAETCAYTPGCNWNGTACVGSITPTVPCELGKSRCVSTNSETCIKLSTGSLVWQGTSCGSLGCNLSTGKCNVTTCTSTSDHPQMANGASYCQTPYIAGSRMWKCTNGTATVTQNYYVTRSCVDPTAEVWGHLLAFAQQKVSGLSGTQCVGTCNSSSQRWCATSPSLTKSNISFDATGAISAIVGKAMTGGGTVNLTASIGLGSLGGTTRGCTSCSSTTKTNTLTFNIGNVTVNINVGIPVAEGSCSSYLQQVTTFVTELWGHLLAFAQQQLTALPSTQCFGTCNSSSQRWCATSPSLTKSNISFDAAGAISAIVRKDDNWWGNG